MTDTDIPSGIRAKCRDAYTIVAHRRMAPPTHICLFRVRGNSLPIILALLVLMSAVAGLMGVDGFAKAQRRTKDCNCDIDMPSKSLKATNLSIHLLIEILVYATTSGELGITTAHVLQHGSDKEDQPN